MRISNAFTGMLSNEYWSSQYCMDELEKAADQGKPMAFIKLDDSSIPAAYNSFVSHSPVINYDDGNDMFYKELYPVINSLL